MSGICSMFNGSRRTLLPLIDLLHVHTSFYEIRVVILTHKHNKSNIFRLHPDEAGIVNQSY